jgi:hypothetical protein
MILRSAALAMAASVLALVAVTAMPATAAFASSPESCVDGTAYYDSGFGVAVGVCEQLFYSGATLTSSQGWMYEPESGVQINDVHMELVYPNGHKIKNCKATKIPPGGNIPRCEWTPKKKGEPKGKYCAKGWQYYNNGYRVIAEACESYPG